MFFRISRIKNVYYYYYLYILICIVLLLSYYYFHAASSKGSTWPYLSAYYIVFHYQLYVRMSLYEIIYIKHVELLIHINL